MRIGRKPFLAGRGLLVPVAAAVAAAYGPRPLSAEWAAP
jgi:hypothetical protein